jgi:hypothetical protein
MEWHKVSSQWNNTKLFHNGIIKLHNGMMEMLGYYSSFEIVNLALLIIDWESRNLKF